MKPKITLISLAKDEQIKTIFPSGATVRAKTETLDYTLTPKQAIDAITRRFEYGINVAGHDRFNWQQGKDDPNFIRNRMNRSMKHLLKILNGSGTFEDLEACLCNLAMMTWYHENGTGLEKAFPNLYKHEV